MAGTFLLVMLVIAVVAAIVIFKVVKSVLQGVLFVSAVLAIVAAVAAVVVVKDALDFQNNFQSSSKLLLFSADNGTRITSGVLIKANESMQPLSGAEVEQLNEAFSRNDYAAMKGSNFKLVLLEEEPIISSMPETIDVEGRNVSRETVLQQLRASTNRDSPDCAFGLSPNCSVEQRASVLSALFTLQSSKDPLLIISGYKKGDVVIYPETAVFKVVKILPEWLFRKVGEKLLQGTAAS